jgi:hypothetical protein
MGKLYDDICRFWHGQRANLQGSFVEIVPKAGGGVRVTRKGKLQQALGSGHPVAVIINGESAAPEAGSSHQVRIHVPLGTIYTHLSQPPGKPEVYCDPAFTPSLEDCRVLEQFMREINGPVGPREWIYLSCILGFGHAALHRVVHGDDEELHCLIRDARKQMEEELLMWERGEGCSPGYDGRGVGFDEEGSEDNDDVSE